MTRSEQPLLQVSDVSRTFGGVTAVDAVSLAVRAGDIHSLIGPNGAGKTTLFNLISGVYLPSAGRITLRGQDIAGLPPNKLAALGMSRTFQNLQVFPQMTATENVLVGGHLRMNAGLIAGMLRLPKLRRAEAAADVTARQLLDFVGLDMFATRLASQMPFGALKRLEIARALMAQPSLLLLDEPAAGLNPSEKQQLQVLIRRIADQGITVLLVEHDMRMVMSLSDHIVVLANGRKLAEGTAESVRHNADVIAAYLGHPVPRETADA